MSREKEFGDGWFEFLRPFFYDPAYYKIGNELRRQISNGSYITPDPKNIFRAFRECSFYNLHSIILGMDSYSTKTSEGSLVADGIAFSSINSKTCPPSLSKIYNVIDQDIYNGENTTLTDTYDLKKWSNQGILLINCGLTTILGNSGVHIQLWQPFISYLLSKLNESKDNIGVILIGSHAKANRKFITNKTWGIFSCEHPIASSYQNRPWKHNYVFSDLTRFQKIKNNIEIKW